MAFLIFTARKIQLKRQISNLQYQDMLVAQQYQNAQEAVTNFQEKMANMKDQISLFTQSASQQQLSQLYSQYGSNMDEAAAARMQQQQAAIQQRAALTSQAVNSVFESINKVQLAKLKSVENRLESQKDSIENKLKMQQEELKSVEEAEKEGIKNSAPTFGLA